MWSICGGERHLLLRAREQRGEPTSCAAMTSSTGSSPPFPRPGRHRQRVRGHGGPQAAGGPGGAAAGKASRARTGSGRKNAAYVRQGDGSSCPHRRCMWRRKVLCHEPLSRGAGSKPHWAELLYRRGGEAVYVCDQHPQGVRQEVYREMIRSRPRLKTWNWRAWSATRRPSSRGPSAIQTTRPFACTSGTRS